jgi:hypothetical protein
VELLCPCPCCGPGAGGGFEGDGVEDEPVVTPGAVLEAVGPVSRLDMNIPPISSRAIANATAITPTMLPRSRSVGIGRLMLSRVSMSLRTGPPGLNSVAIAIPCFGFEWSTRPDSMKFHNEKAPAFARASNYSAATTYLLSNISRALSFMPPTVLCALPSA